MSFPDLLCTEDADFLDPSGFDFRPLETDLAGARDEEEEDESIVKMIELEGRCALDAGFARRLRSHPLECSARLEATEWILEAGSFFGFRPLTVYLAVNYMDRFLSELIFPVFLWCEGDAYVCVSVQSLRHFREVNNAGLITSLTKAPLLSPSFIGLIYFGITMLKPVMFWTLFRNETTMWRWLSGDEVHTNGWNYELLSVACLSLAAKMEECGAPSLPVIQVAGPGRQHFFERDSLFRMEALILSKLNWKLCSVTPFTFIELFARKVNPSQDLNGPILSRVTQLILNMIRVVDYENFRPSSIAAAAVLLATHEIQNLGQIDTGTAASWYPGLDMENIASCCRFMENNLAAEQPGSQAPKSPSETTVQQSPTAVLERQDGSSAVSSSPSNSQSSKRRRWQ